LGEVVKILKATLYVKGIKKAMGVDDRSHWGYVGYTGGGPGGPNRDGGAPSTPYPDYKVYREVECKSVLSEDQKALVEMVKTAAGKYGFELDIVDVTEGRFLNKLSATLKGIGTFPTLVTDNGLKIEGDITEDRIRVLFAK